jgi:hypothetical protein
LHRDGLPQHTQNSSLLCTTPTLDRPHVATQIQAAPREAKRSDTNKLSAGTSPPPVTVGSQGIGQAPQTRLTAAAWINKQETTTTHSPASLPNPKPPTTNQLTTAHGSAQHRLPRPSLAHHPPTIDDLKKRIGNVTAPGTALSDSDTPKDDQLPRWRQGPDPISPTPSPSPQRIATAGEVNNAHRRALPTSPPVR